MSEHVVDRIDPYIFGELSPEAASLVDEHTRTCAACREALADARAVLDVLPHALEPIEPPQRVLDGIMARIAAPPERTTLLRSPRRATAAWALAACLALALLGDGILAARLANATDSGAVALVTPSASPALVPTPSQPTSPPSPRASVRSLPSIAPTARATSVASPIFTEQPRSTRDAAELRIASARSKRDVTRLNALLVARDQELARLRAIATQDAGQLAQVHERLTRSGSEGRPSAAGVVAALENGRVYSVNGIVAHEAWQGTVVQATPTSNALLFTRAPSAPSGDEYQVWVVRKQRTYRIGRVTPHVDTTLEMPMPLEAGDVVAFSEDRLGATTPTQPYLMELAITQ